MTDLQPGVTLSGARLNLLKGFILRHYAGTDIEQDGKDRMKLRNLT